MRLLIISDLHLEFGLYEFVDGLPKFDAAVFAGDIGRPIKEAVLWLADQIKHGPLKDRPVIYVAGNHEFYRTEMHSNLAPVDGSPGFSRYLPIIRSEQFLLHDLQLRCGPGGPRQI